MFTSFKGKPKIKIMKRFFSITAMLAVMGICSVSVAQAQQDSSSTNYDTQQPVEQNQQNQNSTQSDDMKTRDAERVDEQGQSTDQQLQQDADAMQENFEGATIDKVGPNGQKLFRERGKYFYIDEDGKKVKVKKSEVRDKSEM